MRSLDDHRQLFRQRHAEPFQPSVDQNGSEAGLPTNPGRCAAVSHRRRINVDLAFAANEICPLGIRGRIPSRTLTVQRGVRDMARPVLIRRSVRYAQAATPSRPHGRRIGPGGRG